MRSKVRKIRQASFALRVVARKGGKAALVYRRQVDAKGRDRLQKMAVLSPLAFTAATPMLREAVKDSTAESEQPAAINQMLGPGASQPVSADWGARIACFGIISARLRDAEGLLRAVQHLRRADGNEAAWWLGLLTRASRSRAIRALRILTEAVK